MIKLLFLMLFILLGSYSPRADEVPGNDGDFINKLDNIKNPFDDGIPKPVIVSPPPVIVHHEEHIKPKIISPKPVFIPEPVITLPEINVQGVVVGDDMHQAIINDRIVPLQGYIKGAQLISVNKEGVEFLYKGKKFFLKID